MIFSLMFCWSLELYALKHGCLRFGCIVGVLLKNVHSVVPMVQIVMSPRTSCLRVSFRRSKFKRKTRIIHRISQHQVCSRLTMFQIAIPSPMSYRSLGSFVPISKTAVSSFMPIRCVLPPRVPWYSGWVSSLMFYLYPWRVSTFVRIPRVTMFPLHLPAVCASNYNHFRSRWLRWCPAAGCAL